MIIGLTGLPILQLASLKMFAVEGWKLGPLVTQTLPEKNKKKLKRKRDEKEEPPPKELQNQNRDIRNPFAMKTAKTVEQPPKAEERHEKASKTAKRKKQKGGVEEETLQNDKLVKKKRRQDKEERRHQRKLQLDTNDDKQPADQPETPSTEFARSQQSSVSRLTTLQQKMRAKLSGSQFRHINEKLYTTHSSEALSLFSEQPSLFNDVILLRVYLT